MRPLPPRPVAYRLCGNSGRLEPWLAAWVRGKDELLISNYASMRAGDKAPWMLPLRQPIVDKDGHLRLGWWKGNEALKGRRVALKQKNVGASTARRAAASTTCSICMKPSVPGKA